MQKQSLQAGADSGVQAVSLQATIQVILEFPVVGCHYLLLQ